MRGVGGKWKGDSPWHHSAPCEASPPLHGVSLWCSGALNPLAIIHAKVCAILCEMFSVPQPKIFLIGTETE